MDTVRGADVKGGMNHSLRPRQKRVPALYPDKRQPSPGGEAVEARIKCDAESGRNLSVPAGGLTECGADEICSKNIKRGEKA